MDSIRVIHDPVGKTLTIWLDEQAICQETVEEIVFMKDAGGRVIGFEVLHYESFRSPPSISIETAPE